MGRLLDYCTRVQLQGICSLSQRFHCTFAQHFTRQHYALTPTLTPTVTLHINILHTKASNEPLTVVKVTMHINDAALFKTLKGALHNKINKSS